MNIDDLTGKQLGRYELKQLIGVGGMGSVYRAYQMSLNRQVAVKVLPKALATKPDFVKRFEREAQTVAALNHPHIVTIFDYGTEEDIIFVVMPLLSGGTLSQRMQRQRFSLFEITDLLDKLSGALDYAHGQGIIHRDIKPDNIMFDEHNTPYVVDFGIAKIARSDITQITQGGASVGTPAYMPPEQWRGEELTPAADQYALVVVTYQLVTGQLPFTAVTPHEMMYKHLEVQPPAPDLTQLNIPASISAVLLRGLAKSPEKRFESVGEFARAFKAAQSGQFQVAAPPTDAPVSTPSKPSHLSPDDKSYVVSVPKRERSNTNMIILAGTGLALAFLITAAIFVFTSSGNGDDGDENSAVSIISTETATATEAIAAPDDPLIVAQASSPISTPTEMVLPSATNPAVSTQTVVSTVALTSTSTHSPTVLASSTLTLTPTPTATNTPTDIPTNMPTDTPTDMATDMATATDMPTLTPTMASTTATNLVPTTMPIAFTPVAANGTWTPVITTIDGFEMALVPVGCFQMGDHSLGSNSAAHSQCITQAFWIDVYEITNQQYGGASTMPSCSSVSSAPDQPINCVTWAEAQAFCEGRGGRLPTEAEWEYAARSPNSFDYPWGNSQPTAQEAVFDAQQTEPVGPLYRASGASWAGVRDMAGNLAEWTSSLSKPYPFNLTDGRQATPDPMGFADQRVRRGGAFHSNATAIQSAVRLPTDSGEPRADTGFRCIIPSQ